MKTRTQNIASHRLIAVTFAIAAAWIAIAALAVQVDARSGSTAASALAQTADEGTKDCVECYVLPPFDTGYELPADTKVAEPIATF